jgi:hypothetical protein
MILAETDEATDESAFLMWLATLNTVGFSAHGGKGCVDEGCPPERQDAWKTPQMHSNN